MPFPFDRASVRVVSHELAHESASDPIDRLRSRGPGERGHSYGLLVVLPQEHVH